jgi:hypothetical protein
MIMQGIYINKDSQCIFLREKIKNPGKEYRRHREVSLTDIRDEMPLPEKI